MPLYKDGDQVQRLCFLATWASYLSHELGHIAFPSVDHLFTQFGREPCDLIYRYEAVFRWALSQRYGVPLCVGAEPGTRAHEAAFCYPNYWISINRFADSYVGGE